jgi:N-carbamoyl-D-amino-acid hydrolase
MPRTLTVAAAQLGPIARTETREQVVKRLIHLMEEAARFGAEIIVYPEVALTPFFPHWWIESEKDLDSFFEHAMPSTAVQPLFTSAKRLGVGFCLGYAEAAFEDGRTRRFNTAALVNAEGQFVGKYRKIHLPGYSSQRPNDAFQNLEKRYFETGNLGFPVWSAFDCKVGILICYDRRWPESYRVLALQGVELILIGYNTPVKDPTLPEADHLANFHNHLSMQAGAYQSSAWVVGVAKAGIEEGVEQIGQSCIIAPSGEIVAQTVTLSDEVIIGRCDLEMANRYKRAIFDFAANRKPQNYRAITQ